MEFRNTKQKKIVLDAVRALGNHPTAEQVFMYVHDSCPKIAKGTVYRNLNLLHAKEEIRKFEMPNAPARFDHNVRSHYHLKCNICGKVVDGSDDYVSNKLANFSQEGFDVESFNLVLCGICATCKNEKYKGEK